jgi:hypothetical protein
MLESDQRLKPCTQIRVQDVDAADGIQHSGILSFIKRRLGSRVTKSCAMSNTHLLSTTVLALVSCVGSTIVQYVALSLLTTYSTVRLLGPLRPSARMKQLENILLETADLLQKAIEERVLSKREFILDVQLRLCR